MKTDAIKAIQTKLGVTADGVFGPVSRAACKAHLIALMPSPHPFPKPDQVTAFYGPHGNPNGSYSPPTKKIVLPFPVYYDGKPVLALHPHEKCADALLRVFERLAIIYPDHDSREKAGILTYDGLYNPRPMRGGSSWSMHSWAIAIDLDAGNNGFRASWPENAMMPFEVMEAFASEGFVPAAGIWQSHSDAMHFEATNPN